MHIEFGKYYTNKTWRFLLPSLRGHGDIFIRKFNPVFKLAVGIHDMIVEGSKIANGRSIFLLCDKLVNPREFNEFLDWVKNQDYYIADYCPDSEVLNSRKHMIVLRIPKLFDDAYDHFLQGNYSLMYLDEEIKIMFSNNNSRKKEYDILTRNPQIVEEFTNSVNEEFVTSGKTKPTPLDFKNAELELPLKKSEEIFSYKENNTIFFNEKKDKTWTN